MKPINETPLVNQQYQLKKSTGKGGWTFVAFTDIPKNQHSHFGTIKVSGTIDDYELENVHLMSMGNGVLLLPVKAEIRKIIGKNEGDWVYVTLYSQELPTVVPDDFMLCLKDEPDAYENFTQLSDIEQKEMISWIYSAKKDELKIERIVQSIDKLLSGI